MTPHERKHRRGRPAGLGTSDHVRINVALPRAVHAAVKYRCAIESKTLDEATTEALAAWADPKR